MFLVSLIKNACFNFGRIAYKHVLEGFLWVESGKTLNQATRHTHIHTHQIILKGEITFLTNNIFQGATWARWQDRRPLSMYLPNNNNLAAILDKSASVGALGSRSETAKCQQCPRPKMVISRRQAHAQDFESPTGVLATAQETAPSLWAYGYISLCSWSCHWWHLPRAPAGVMMAHASGVDNDTELRAPK